VNSYDPDEILKKMRKDADSDWPERLLKAIENVQLLTDEKRIDSARKNEHPLTETELNVLRCASVGLTYRMTADITDRSLATVQTHAKGAIFKLKAKNMTHAVSIALRKGLIN
jgi:DNA-binding CsgD family transcriptional regulator